MVMNSKTALTKALVIFAMLGAVPATAQDVTLTADIEDKSVLVALRSASLTLGIERDGGGATQDYVAAARADYRRILTALYEAGYFGGTISIRIDGREARSIAPLDAPQTIGFIDIAIQTGPQFAFGRAEVSPVVSATQLPDSFATGKPAGTGPIKEAVRSAIDDWRNNGHAKAEPVDQKIVARHDARELNASITIAPGPQLAFGAITIEGEQDVREQRIVQIAGIPQGAVFSPRDLELAARRLRRTGTFGSVTIREADEIGPDQTLPISIVVAESKPRRIGFGIELSSIEGLRVSSYWMHRNFLGGAERFRIEGEVSGIGGETGGTDYAIRASLDRPAIYGPDTNLFVRTEAVRLDEPDYLIDKASLEIGATRLLGDELEFEAGIGILTAREVTPAFTREYSLITLPLEATFDKRDDKTNANNGYFINAQATPFVSLGSRDLGIRAYGDVRGYRGFGDGDKVVLAGRMQIGSVFGVEVDQAPADYLFHSGGGGTVRGQPYQSLAFEHTGRGSGGYRTGGLAFAGAQLEARYAVTDTISAVGFYDIGLISEAADFNGDTLWHAGVGLGVRYNTGIGPIRLDVGTPANGDGAFGSAQVYIGIGQSF